LFEVVFRGRFLLIIFFIEKVHGFEAHSDYLRCLQVHPTQPYLLSSSGEFFVNVP